MTTLPGWLGDDAEKAYDEARAAYLRGANTLGAKLVLKASQLVITERKLHSLEGVDHGDEDKEDRAGGSQ